MPRVALEERTTESDFKFEGTRLIAVHGDSNRQDCFKCFFDPNNCLAVRDECKRPWCSHTNLEDGLEVYFAVANG